MMAVWMMLAQAGSVNVTVDALGEKQKLTLDGVAACEWMEFETKAEHRTVGLGVRVVPQQGDALMVSVEVVAKDFGDTVRSVTLKPTMLVQDGKAATLTVDLEGDPVTLSMKASGFQGVECPVTRSRVVRSSSVEGPGRGERAERHGPRERSVRDE